MYVIKILKVWSRNHNGSMMFAKAHSLEESWEIKLGPDMTIIQQLTKISAAKARGAQEGKSEGA